MSNARDLPVHLTDEEIRDRIYAWFGDCADIVKLDDKEVKIIFVQCGSIYHEDGRPHRDQHRDEIDGLCETMLNNLNYPSAGAFFHKSPNDVSLKTRLAVLQESIDSWKRCCK